MNSNETMMEQIRRLNEEQRLIHERRKLEAINKIKQMREKMKNDTAKHTTYTF